MSGRHRGDEVEGGTPYLHPPSRRRAQRSRGFVFIPLAGAVALAVLAGVAAYVIVDRDHGCGDQKIALRVVASPDIQPAIGRIAEGYNKTPKRIDGKCVQVAVKAADSATVANAFSGTEVVNGDPANADLWVPDSSLWVAQIRSTDKGAQAVQAPVGSAAHSPVVLAAPKSAVPRLQAAFGEASWSGILAAANAATPDGLGRKVRVIPLDPVLNSAGLGALLAGGSVLKQAGKGDEELVGLLRALSDSTVSSPANMFATMSKPSSRAPLGIVSEQGVWAYNSRNRPQNPIYTMYPAEGTFNLDYPIVVTASDATMRKAAQSFATALGTPNARQTVRGYGFRTPDNKAGDALKDNGLKSKAPQAMPIPDAATVMRMSQAWKRIKLGTRMLSLDDVSGTMALPAVGTNISRVRMIAQIATEGLKLQPDKAELGMWLFSTNLNGKGVDWKEEVSMGPLGAKIGGVTRRQRIIESLARMQAKPNGDTGLNDTLAAAYDMMKKTYEPDKVNTILVFTDGVGNDDPEGGISNEEILKKLKADFDPSKPISIIIIAMGADDPAGRKQMQAIAAATGGQAYFPRTVLEIRKILLSGVSRRLCQPKCDTQQ